MSRVQSGDIGARQDGFPGEFILNPIGRRATFATIEPINQTQRPKILTAIRFLFRNADMRHGFPGQARDVDGNNLEVVERAVLQRIGVVTGFAKVPFRKGNGVRHDDAPGTQFARVDLEGRGIKNDQNIGSVAGGINLPASEIDLIGGNAIGRPDRSANLGGKIREGRKIVAGKGRGQGEPPAGQLDTVAGVAGKPDDDRFQFFPRDLPGLGFRVWDIKVHRRVQSCGSPVGQAVVHRAKHRCERLVKTHEISSQNRYCQSKLSPIRNMLDNPAKNHKKICI